MKQLLICAAIDETVGFLSFLEADFCVIPPLCHVNASCAQNLELGEKNCTCNEGFHGDGYDCNPNNPCQINNGDCDPYSTDCVYVSPGKVFCFFSLTDLVMSTKATKSLQHQ